MVLSEIPAFCISIQLLSGMYRMLLMMRSCGVNFSAWQICTYVSRIVVSTRTCGAESLARYWKNYLGKLVVDLAELFTEESCFLLSDFFICLILTFFQLLSAMISRSTGVRLRASSGLSSGLTLQLLFHGVCLIGDFVPLASDEGARLFTLLLQCLVVKCDELSFLTLESFECRLLLDLQPPLATLIFRAWMSLYEYEGNSYFRVSFSFCPQLSSLDILAAPWLVCQRTSSGTPMTIWLIL